MMSYTTPAFFSVGVLSFGWADGPQRVIRLVVCADVLGPKDSTKVF